MRKVDYLRNIYNKAVKEGNNNAIYLADLPEAFRRKGCESPSAIPSTDKNGLLGIVLQHPYWDDEAGQYLTFDEYYVFRKCVPVPAY